MDNLDLEFLEASEDMIKLEDIVAGLQPLGVKRRELIEDALYEELSPAIEAADRYLDSAGDSLTSSERVALLMLVSQTSAIWHEGETTGIRMLPATSHFELEPLDIYTAYIDGSMLSGSDPQVPVPFLQYSRDRLGNFLFASNLHEDFCNSYLEALQIDSQDHSNKEGSINCY
jgi:hypothetical protein